MDPEIVSDRPGRCPKCRMALEPKPKPKAAGDTPGSDAGSLEPKDVPGLAPIDVSEEGMRLAGVRTDVAVKGRIARTLRASGIVRADETRIRHVHTKISGWIEKLYVNFTGESVARGRPILSIYSQELLGAQHEYLQAKQASSTMQRSDSTLVRDGAVDLLAASRRRLELLDVPKSLIAQLDQGGEPSRTVTIAAPVGGVVMSKSVFEGQQVDPGTELFTVTDLSRVWVEADLYESEGSAVTVGTEGRVSLVGDSSQVMTGKIKYIYPYVNAETRTLRVRFEFPNPNLSLKLESFANVEIPVETGEGAIVPDSAVMDTGVRQVVFVSPRDGHFVPRLVKVGVRAEGRAQILSGVAPGERVAIKANFLLDSESRLRAAMMPSAPSLPSTSTISSASSHPGHGP
jgi:RND family efflux transporter MFP subunit